MGPRAPLTGVKVCAPQSTATNWRLGQHAGASANARERTTSRPLRGRDGFTTIEGIGQERAGGGAGGGGTRADENTRGRARCRLCWPGSAPYNVREQRKPAGVAVPATRPQAAGGGLGAPNRPNRRRAWRRCSSFLGLSWAGPRPSLQPPKHAAPRPTQTSTAMPPSDAAAPWPGANAPGLGWSVTWQQGRRGRRLQLLVLSLAAAPGQESLRVPEGVEQA
jgi:hypothetical protein